MVEAVAFAGLPMPTSEADVSAADQEILVRAVAFQALTVEKNPVLLSLGGARRLATGDATIDFGTWSTDMGLPDHYLSPVSRRLLSSLSWAAGFGSNSAFAAKGRFPPAPPDDVHF